VRKGTEKSDIGTKEREKEKEGVQETGCGDAKAREKHKVVLGSQSSSRHLCRGHHREQEDDKDEKSKSD